MEQYNIPTDSLGKNLLGIFPKDEDLKGNDLLAMSDFFQISIDQICAGIQTDTEWHESLHFESLAGEIASAIRCGIHLSDMETLIADSSHFGQDIINGLDAGIYHIGTSKEVSGNLRPAIVDDKGRIVKYFTLKEAVDPTKVLADISTISIQLTLQTISLQIDEIYGELKYLDDKSRLKLSNKFIYDRDKILSAVTANESDRNRYLNEADTYLMEGLLDLYSDFDLEVKKLSTKKFISKIKKIDDTLKKIYEDMQMISRYVGVRVYLFSCRDRFIDADRVLNEYQYKLQTWTENKIEKSNYTAFELIHENCSYKDDNIDFWLNAPNHMISEIDNYEKYWGKKIKMFIT